MPRKGKRSTAQKQRWHKFDESQHSVPAEQLVSSPPHSNRELNVPQPSHANVTRVFASRSQKHPKYADSRNSQCSCNSATFLAFLHELKHLESADLDLVLDRGHAMYALTVSQLVADRRDIHPHLNKDEIPQVVLGYRQQHIMTLCHSKVGLFTEPSAFDDPNLADRLQCLSSEVNYALLFMGSLCIAVFRDQQGRYGFFDPHSRRANGSPFGPFDDYAALFGKAVMFIYTRLTDLITKIVTCFEQLGTNPETQYEIVPLIFHSVDEMDANLAHAEPDPDVSHVTDQDLNTMSSVRPAESETSLPSCSVKESICCSGSAPDANKVMHVRSSEGTVEYPMSDVAKNDNQHVPDLEKRSSKERRRLKRRAMALERKKANSDADVTLSHRREQDLKTMSSVTQPETETSLPSYSVTECTPCADNTHDTNEFIHVSSSEGRVAYPTLDTPPQHDNQHMPDLSKLNKKQRLKFKKRLMAMEKKIAIRAEKNRRMEIQRMNRNKTEREKYAKDQFCTKQKKSRQCYRQNVETRKRKILNITSRYKQDSNFQQRKKCYITNRYSQDIGFKQRQKSYITNRYSQDIGFKQRKRSKLNSRYQSNAHFRQARKSYITNRYANDPAFKSKQKEAMRQLMRNKRRVLKTSNNVRCALKIRRKYRQMNRQQNHRDDSLIREAIEIFRSRIKNGPTYVCTVCHRALFPNQVRPCNRSNYVEKPHVVEMCLTGRFVHVCTDECQNSQQCRVPEERKREWICFTCHDHLKSGNMPSLAMANNLELADIPNELCDLNILERHLIAKCITFAKIIPLPKGGQRAIHGNVVCVPSEVQETVTALPRLRSDSQVLRVKLKRRLSYKGHQLFQTVTWSKLVRALLKLKQVHPQYTDVTIRDDAELCDPTIRDDDDEDSDEEDKMDDSDYNVDDLMEIDTFEKNALCEADRNDSNDEQSIDSVSQSSRAHEPEQQSNNMQQDGDEPNGGIALESCLQPTDVSEEILSFSEGIYSVAPAEGNKPVSFFRTPNLEAMAFPVQFPTGQNTLDEERQKKLTPCSYFKTRLCCVDERFARDPNYLFFAQFVTEIYQAKSSMRIQLRKGRPLTRDGRKITNAMLQDRHEVERLVRNKDAIRFMTTLRGTPAYWQKTTKDLFAMIRQLGTPTFFCTFSAAEMRWKEVITAIKAQQGEQVNFDELDWSTKCEILRSNPVTTMRMFDKRVEALLRDLLLSPAQPIGKVIDYFYRLEFQHRGSPHIHMLIWCENAPVFEEDSDLTVCDFVSRYITAELPDPITQPELHRKVTEVQMHSKKHSKTCIKHTGASCRFGFPKQPAPKTMIIRSAECQDPNVVNEAKAKLNRVGRLLVEPANASLSLQQLLARCELTVEDFKQCLSLTATGSSVILKRDPKDCWVNGYNRHLLDAWDGNMDIQFILNPYSCIMYICSYISKAEHGLSEYLKTLINNSRDDNVNESDEMKKVMQAYTKKREVSAQECVARACGLHMKQCTRSIVFVQTDENALKMSYPMSYLENKTEDSVNVWMSGLPDKYLCRPETPEFEAMCLADFAATCRILYGKQARAQSAIPLLNQMGFVQKRTNEKPAIIKYHIVSEEKFPEQFHRTLLKLYLPHRSDSELKSESFPTYKSYHECACVQPPDLERPVRVARIVKLNRDKYEKHRDDIQSAINEYEQNGDIRNEWCNLAPESEMERLECIDELEARRNDDDNVQ